MLQLGGAEPETLMRATDVAVSSSHVNYEEINLNCGCPSAAATCCSQRYGASLMHDPHGVAACLRAMARASPNAPVSVKCRLGTNERNGYKLLSDFISIVSSGAGVRHFIIHSRECVLGGCPLFILPIVSLPTPLQAASLSPLDLPCYRLNAQAEPHDSSSPSSMDAPAEARLPRSALHVQWRHQVARDGWEASPRSSQRHHRRVWLVCRPQGA